MISQKFLELIEKNAEKLADEWLKDVKKNPQTHFFGTFDQDLLRQRAIDMYKHLSHWLNVQTPKEQIAKHYRAYGRERCQEGFPLPQLVYSFILFRRHLWLFILNAGFFDTAYELLRGLELNNRVVLFFDRALYNMMMGYEECRGERK